MNKEFEDWIKQLKTLTYEEMEKFYNKKQSEIDYYKMAADAFDQDAREKQHEIFNMQIEIDSWKKALLESIEDEHGKQEEGFECNLFKQYESKWVKKE